MIDLKQTQKNDPVKRDVEHGLDDMKGSSPFDPPSVYEDKETNKVDFDAMNEALKELVEDHKIATKKIEEFETALVEYKTNGYKLNKEINTVFADFYKYYDNELLVHNEKEDKVLFPLLNEKLLAAGEHSVGENPSTAIDEIG